MESMTRIISIFIGCILVCSLYWACETEFIPEDINLEPELVVEGYIELGPDALPAYILLTRSRPFFSQLDSAALNNVFVRNAQVTVEVDGQKYPLTEFCLNDLTPDIRLAIAARLGLNTDSLVTNICAYIDIQNQVKPVVGKNYILRVNSEGQSLQATTSIPAYTGLDSTWWREAPGVPSDTLLQLMAKIQDPPGIKNFYRYFCSLNGGSFITPFNSVFDDALIDGKKFEFRLIRPSLPGEDFDQTNFGLFRVGDSIEVKWSTIDESHFNFWNTYEFNRGNQGPFSTYTTIQTNVIGGLGNWGGYHSKTYKLKVKRS
jgi:hypothetical protein